MFAFAEQMLPVLGLYDIFSWQTTSFVINFQPVYYEIFLSE